VRRSGEKKSKKKKKKNHLSKEKKKTKPSAVVRQKRDLKGKKAKRGEGTQHFSQERKKKTCEGGKDGFGRDGRGPNLQDNEKNEDGKHLRMRR